MPVQFDRTQTDTVLEAYLITKSTDEETIQKFLRDKGYRRKLSDIKRMVKNLEECCLINNEDGERLTNLVQRISRNEPNDFQIHVAKDFLNYITENGLAAYPFLQAVQNYPNQSQLIQIETVKLGKNSGFYNLREGQDVVAAMGNFFAFTGFLEPRSQKGKYELSILGKKALPNDLIEITRVKCDQNEPCREICPTNAISLNKIIPETCIECGLCTQVCPYGAIQLNCKDQIKLDIFHCTNSSGNISKSKCCDYNKVKANEISLQRWIKSTFKLGHLSSEIPGVGPYPDIVTKEFPSFIEVKKRGFTESRIENYSKQIMAYMDYNKVKSTLEKLKEKEFIVTEPEKFVYIAPVSKETNKFIQKIKKGNPPYSLSFVGLDTLVEINRKMMNDSEIDMIEIWSNLKNWEIN